MLLKASLSSLIVYIRVFILNNVKSSCKFKIGCMNFFNRGIECDFYLSAM